LRLHLSSFWLNVFFFVRRHYHFHLDLHHLHHCLITEWY
jgi:hypothetical protein